MARLLYFFLPLFILKKKVVFLAVGLLFDLAAIIIAGTILAYAARYFKQPLLVAYIIAGIIIGPIGLHLINDYTTIAELSELGVAFLLFTVGMELDFSRMFEYKKIIFFGGILQVFVTAAIVAVIMGFFAMNPIEAVYVGFILAFSSTVIVVKLLSSANQLNSLEGKLIIGYALVQDLVAVIVLPLLANPAAIANPAIFFDFFLRMLAMFLLAFVLSKIVIPRVLDYSAKSQEIFYLTTLSSCFAFIFLSQLLGFSIAVGGFIGGIAMARVPSNNEALANIRYIRDLFATIFFVSLGMQFNIISLSNLPLLIVLLLIVFVLNPIIFGIINLYAGFGLRTSIFVGLALAQASEFSFVFASQGLKLSQISQSTFDISIFVILLSLIATPYLMQSTDLAYRIVSRLKKLFNIQDSEYFRRRIKKIELYPRESEKKQHIIIAGCGVFGAEIAENLHSTNRIVIVDHDPEVISKFSKRGIPAVYGERFDEAIWKKIGLQEARILIATIPDTKTLVSLVKKAKELNSKIIVFARAHYFSEALELYRNGADFVIMPQVIGGNYCLKVICDFLETGKLEETNHLRGEFFSYLKEKAGEEREKIGKRN